MSNENKNRQVIGEKRYVRDGSITLTIDVDLFKLTREERKWVLDMLNVFTSHGSLTEVPDPTIPQKSETS